MEAVVRKIPGLIVTEREHLLPLDHAVPAGERISVFTRELADPCGLERPILLYLEGGPGCEPPRPSRTGLTPAWLERALQDFRVLMLDQRGTGRSTPVGPSLPGTPSEQADYLSHFRADSIVSDAELIRQELGVERWSVLGQSFGGFCVLRYLSAAPQGLREAMFTGGLPALGPRIDDVYRATYARIAQRTQSYYERYPEDRARVTALVERLERRPIELPGGDLLDPRGLRQLGNLLGMSYGAEKLHYILELDADSQGFLHDFQGALWFSRNPLYAVLHEACWADGGSTRWSAERILSELGERPAELFTGEHVYPWMFEQVSALRPLREAAGLLAEREWPALYDAAQLAANEVPAAALIYADDPYVEREFSEQTACAVRGMRRWITNEYDHDGLDSGAGRVFGRLLDLARGLV